MNESRRQLLHLANLVAGHLSDFTTIAGGNAYHLNRASYPVSAVRPNLRHAYFLDPARWDAILDDFFADRDGFTDRTPDEVIQHAGRPYLERWYLVPREDDRRRIYLHRFLTDDPVSEGLHDHPWPSVSLVLRGALVEYWRATGTADVEHRSEIPRFTMTLRAAELAHRLELASERPVTLFVTGAHQREWGFWRRDERGRPAWRYWRDVA